MFTTLKTWATCLNFQICSSPLTLEFFKFIFIRLFLIADKDIKWTSFPVSDKNSQDWFLMNTCLLCAVKPSGHTDTFVHGIQRVWIFSMVSKPLFSLQCSPAYSAGQLQVHVLAAFEYIHADCPAGWFASLFLHFKAFCSIFSSQLPVFIKFIQSSCNLDIHLFAKFGWSQTTGLKIISRGEGRKRVGGTWYSWFRSPGN